MSSTRIFIEWALSRVYLRFPRLIVTDFMAKRVLYHEVAASWLISMIAIILCIMKKLKTIDDAIAMKEVLPKMSDYILPLLVHNNHTVRMHAIYAFKQLEKQKSQNGLERCLHINYNIPPY